jgi:hypothetical protein
MIRQLRVLLRAVFSGGEPGCAVAVPVWLRPVVWLAAGAAGAGVWVLAGAPVWRGPVAAGLGVDRLAAVVEYVPLGMLAGLVVASVLGRVCEAWHGHCTVCGHCSAGAGVATCRTSRGADDALRAAGWLVDAAGDYCPAHNPLGGAAHDTAAEVAS